MRFAPIATPNRLAITSTIMRAFVRKPLLPRGQNAGLGSMTELAGLSGQQVRELTSEKPAPRGVSLERVVLGPGTAGLGPQVVVARSSEPPSAESLRTLHSERLGKRIFPLVVAASDGSESVWIMGPSPDTSPVGPIPEGQAVRILQAGLDAPSGIRGRQRISQLLRSFESTEIAGMTNSGLFATHFLVEGVRDTTQWSVAEEEAKPWLALRGVHLVVAMGYSSRRAAAAAHVLTTSDSNHPRAIAVLLFEPLHSAKTLKQTGCRTRQPSPNHPRIQQKSDLCARGSATHSAGYGRRILQPDHPRTCQDRARTHSAHSVRPSTIRPLGTAHTRATRNPPVKAGGLPFAGALGFGVVTHTPSL